MSETETTKMTVGEPKELPLIDEGDYTAELTEVETDVEGRYGTMVRLHFEVKGEDLQALASQTLNPNTKLFKWANFMLDKELEVGEELDFQSLKGKKALVTVRNRKVMDKDGEEGKDKDGKPLFTSVIKEIRKLKSS